MKKPQQKHEACLLCEFKRGRPEKVDKFVPAWCNPVFEALAVRLGDVACRIGRKLPVPSHLQVFRSCEHFKWRIAAMEDEIMGTIRLAFDDSMPEDGLPPYGEIASWAAWHRVLWFAELLQTLAWFNWDGFDMRLKSLSDAAVDNDLLNYLSRANPACVNGPGEAWAHALFLLQAPPRKTRN
jgi:hypothetical protein